MWTYDLRLNLLLLVYDVYCTLTAGGNDWPGIRIERVVAGRSGMVLRCSSTTLMLEILRRLFAVRFRAYTWPNLLVTNG